MVAEAGAKERWTEREVFETEDIFDESILNLSSLFHNRSLERFLSVLR
jgi:hypothetical protein